MVVVATLMGMAMTMSCLLPRNLAGCVHFANN